MSHKSTIDHSDTSRYEYCCFIGPHCFYLPEQKLEAEMMEQQYIRVLLAKRVLDEIQDLKSKPKDGFPVGIYRAPVYRREKQAEKSVNNIKNRWIFFCLLKEFRSF